MHKILKVVSAADLFTLKWLIMLSDLVFFFSLGPYLQRMEVPRLGVEWELQLPAYTTTTATQDLSRTCNLHHSSGQGQILNPLSEAGDQTCIFMDASQICFHRATTGTPPEASLG